jgi:lipopolysaccharide transport system ATP-binding protein
VWVLRNISFEVEQGEVLGIIGKNGAGKSTLLKILSKVTSPTTGTIRAQGRIASLLEIGTGFHPEMTGRENIFMNGSIMGMTKTEIRQKFDEIVEFSGVKRFIDTPVKRYSSGMMVRLGFAVAAHLESRILVVDEVLAVGDAEFQKKAIGKMQDVSHKDGRTVLFVSHNMASLRNLCQNGILLENGTIEKTGSINDVVDYYLKDRESSFEQDFVIINDSFRRYMNQKQVEFISIKRLNKYQIAVDEPIELIVTLKNNENCKKARLIGMLNFEDETRVGLFSSKEFNLPVGKKEFEIQIKLTNHNLSYGKYYFDFNIGVGDFTNSIIDYDVVYKTISFEVEFDSIETNLHINYWRSNWGRNCFKDVELIVTN